MIETVEILLATYNGEKFIQEQLDSLMNQSNTNFKILIRDDGSTDNTIKIINEYQQKFPTKITVLKDNKKNVGATQNFGILLQYATADYIFFCDQDDVWLPNKIEDSLQKMKAIENDKAIPCLIFSDMKVIDEYGNITSDSVWQQLHLHPKYFVLNRLLVQNIPHGCTMLINKAMRNLASPIPKAAMLHDHWIALLATACGKYTVINEPLLLLRNHTQNVTRQHNSIFDKLQRASYNLFSKSTYEHFIAIRVSQAEVLLARIRNKISKENSELIENFILLKNAGSWQRKKIFIKNKFYRTTFAHTLKMILRS